MAAFPPAPARKTSVALAMAAILSRYAQSIMPGISIPPRPVTPGWWIGCAQHHASWNPSVQPAARGPRRAAFTSSGTQTGGSGLGRSQCDLHEALAVPGAGASRYNKSTAAWLRKRIFQVGVRIDNAGNTHPTPASFTGCGCEGPNGGGEVHDGEPDQPGTYSVMITFGVNSSLGFTPSVAVG